MGIIGNDLHVALPFYDSVDRQNHRRGVCFGDLYTFELLCNVTRLLPWQLRRPHSTATFDHLWLVCADVDSDRVDILPDIDADDIEIIQVGSYDYITYFGGIDLAADLPCGKRYLEYEGSDGLKYYSEVLTIQVFDDDTTDVYLSSDRVDTMKSNGDLIIIS